MIKTLMILWAAAAGPDGTITAGGLSSEIVTMDECKFVKQLAGNAVRVLCLEMGGTIAPAPVAPPVAPPPAKKKVKP